MSRRFTYVPVNANDRPIVRYGDNPERRTVVFADRVFDGPTEIGIVVRIAPRRTGIVDRSGGFVAIDACGDPWPAVFTSAFAAADALATTHGFPAPDTSWRVTWPNGRPTTTCIGDPL